eukprot:CAMPEP_0117473136 /NCGR_PEP_ID=MMETSP0784-20121206/8615_1 /TAXON_ID=39447 /ORGANISM="" /LENGTH=161 /DNA_ID=CAMNT_0005267325 /DNA_START=84 /DNA_END=569 /DNA_ORIENTATION=+
MGCACVKDGNVSDPREKQARKDAELARRLQAEEDRHTNNRGGSSSGAPPNWAAAGRGNMLGGGSYDTLNNDALSAEERRQLALEAAERRQNKVNGISEQKVIQMREKQQKDEYLGKIAEYYNKKKIEMPMGLNAASAEQLRKHWDGLRKGESVSDMVLETP